MNLYFLIKKNFQINLGNSGLSVLGESSDQDCSGLSSCTPAKNRMLLLAGTTPVCDVITNHPSEEAVTPASSMNYKCVLFCHHYANWL